MPTQPSPPRRGLFSRLFGRAPAPPPLFPTRATSVPEPRPAAAPPNSKPISFNPAPAPVPAAPQLPPVSAQAPVSPPGLAVQGESITRVDPAPAPAPELSEPLAYQPPSRQVPTVAPSLPISDAGEPKPVASRALRVDEQQPYAELRRLVAAGALDRAASLCEDFFAGRPEVRDPYGHPVYLKESMRIALSKDDLPRALALAAQLESQLPSSDPGAKVLLARYYVKTGNNSAAREAWQAILARSSAFEEALQWLRGNPQSDDSAQAQLSAP